MGRKHSKAKTRHLKRMDDISLLDTVLLEYFQKTYLLLPNEVSEDKTMRQITTKYIYFIIRLRRLSSSSLSTIHGFVDRNVIDKEIKKRAKLID